MGEAIRIFGHGFKTVRCYSCAMLFAMVDDAYDARQQDGRSFWCPNGHEQHFTRKQNEEQRLAKELENVSKRLEWAQQDVKTERERAAHEERRARSARGHATRLRKRIAAGQCPCCSETFANVAKHIADKHPKYVPAEEDAS